MADCLEAGVVDYLKAGVVEVADCLKAEVAEVADCLEPETALRGSMARVSLPQ